MPCEDDYVLRTDPTSPHIGELEAVVELVEISTQRPGKLRVMVVLINQLAEPFDSPAASA